MKCYARWAYLLYTYAILYAWGYCLAIKAFVVVGGEVWILNKLKNHLNSRINKIYNR